MREQAVKRGRGEEGRSKHKRRERDRRGKEAGREGRMHKERK